MHLRFRPGRLAALAALCLVLAACASDRYVPGWHVIDPSTKKGALHLRFLLEGVKMTLGLSAASLFFGVILGLVGALMSRSDSRLLRGTAQAYVELLRMLPLFVLLLWIFYALPIVIRSLPPELAEAPGLSHLAAMSPFAAATIALSLNAGAFLTEIFRAGIESIPRGHVEAARSLGMSRGQTMRKIVLPQALRRMLPPTASQFIHTVKDSSLASAIGLMELTRRVTELQTQTYRPLELYTFLAIEYLVILLIVSQLARYLERKVVME